MVKQKPGFPKPLVDFDDPDDVIALRRMVWDEALSVSDYFLHDAPIGALRMADPILGDFVVMAREAWGRVERRLDELGFFDLDGVPPSQDGVPEDQA